MCNDRLRLDIRGGRGSMATLLGKISSCLTSTAYVPLDSGRSTLSHSVLLVGYLFDAFSV